MAIFRKILCAVDFSEISIRALQWAEYLAKKFDSELIVMHSISVPMTDPYFYDAETNQSKVSEILEDFVAPLKIKHDKLICSGEPSIEIRKRAEAIHASVIVMGTSGIKGISHRLLGSTAEHVMRHATIPVITISPLCTSPRRLQENRVLIPLANVDKAPPEMDIMKDIVNALGAEAALMHVVSYSEAMYQVKSEILPFNATTFETKETITKLRKIGQVIFGSSLISAAVDFGDVDIGVLREAGSGLYDFILMNIHPEQFLGSFTNSKGYNIVSSAPIPVITMKTSEKAHN
ncbi:universal stress protein [bacterium]|nr:universal stress protein [bacterium]MCI0619350.1 universal stress protein [bacterium]